MGRKQIPDRWLNYRPMRRGIDHARIVPIKTPLPSHKFNDSYLSKYQWTPRDVMESIPNLGLVIDITYKTPAYYDIREFTDYGVDHVKIPCMGHNLPNEEVYHEFCNTVDRFISLNTSNDRVIALHCTHGVNRTGYLLCRYLIERLFYKPDQALYTFEENRGYPVERENYIEALYRLNPERNLRTY